MKIEQESKTDPFHTSFLHHCLDDCRRYVRDHTRAMRDSVLMFVNPRKAGARALVLLGLIFSVARSVAAEDAPALFPIRQNGKFGYINATGEIVIAPQFLRNGLQDGRHFQEGLQAVWVGDKAGYIDASGKMVIAPQFGLAQAFSEGLAAVRPTEAPWKWGYIEKTGRFVIPPQFDEAHVFSDGIAQVVVGGHAGYIDKSGAFIVPAQYRSYSPQHSTFAEGLACVETNGKWGYIDKQGKVVIEAQFGWPSSFHDGLAVVQVGEKFATRWGFIDRTGSLAIEPQFQTAWPFSEGLARVEGKSGAMEFIDKTGKAVFKVPEGRWAGEFSEGLVNVQIGVRAREEKWGYVDRTGKWVIEPRFQRAEPFYKGLAQVIVENKVAYINQVGHYVWGPDSGNEALAMKLRTQVTPEDWRKNQEELVRLAKLIDPVNPPFKEPSLDSGGAATEVLQKLAAGGSEQARQLLERLLSYTPNPTMVEFSPDLAAMQQGDIRTQVARALIAIGDPFVLPTLRVWLNDARKVDGELDHFSRTTVGCAVEGVKQFRDEVSLVPLTDLLKSSGIDRWTREAIFAAIAELGLPPSKQALLGGLKDEEISEPVRCAVAAALVRLGESAGREFLLKTYDLYLDSLRKRASDPGRSRAELEFLGDAELIAKLKAKAEAESPGGPKNNINTLLDSMLVSAMSVEGRKGVALDGDPKKINQRLHAISVLGRQGGRELLPFLEALRDSPDDYPKSSVNDWNDLKRNAANSAIRQILMHHSQQPGAPR